MQKNVGIIDRTIRITLGLAILGICWYLKSWWGLLGLVMLLTAFFGFCPIYTICRRSKGN